MPTFEKSLALPVSAEKAFAWHERPGALPRLTPPWTDLTPERFEGIRDGQRAIFRVAAGPLRVRWVAEHHDYIAGRQFYDRQVQGPFRAWDHQHRFVPTGPDASTLIDHIEYEPPLGRLGGVFGGWKVVEELEKMFAYRHRITHDDLALHEALNPEGRRLRIAVSGASGFIGSSLVPLLTTGGHEVLRMVRRPTRAPDEIYWNHREDAIEADKLEGLDAVIHLAGENVLAARWTDEKKARILRSRETGTKLLAETLARLDEPPTTFLAASAIGYYGDRGTEVLTEEAAPGERGFLTAVTRAWEAAAKPASAAGIRTVNLRIGVVLSPRGGVLASLKPLFLLGLGGRVGPEDLYVSWIALDDALGAVYHALLTDVEGPVNVTAPAPVTMPRFVETLGRVLRRPAWVRVPAGLARFAAGDVAEETLLMSARVIPQRLQQSGYSFRFADLESALRHQLGRTSS